MDSLVEGSMLVVMPHQLDFAEYERDSMWKWPRRKNPKWRNGKAVSSKHPDDMVRRLNHIQRDLESIRVDLNHRIDKVKKAIDEALE